MCPESVEEALSTPVQHFQDRIKAELDKLAVEKATIVSGNPTLVPQFQLLEQQILAVSGAVNQLDTDSPVLATAGAVSVDQLTELAIQTLHGIPADLSVDKDTLCGIVKDVQLYAAAEHDIPIQLFTPASCYSNPAPTLLWQIKLQDTNSKVVGIQDSRDSANLKKLEALSQSITAAAAGAGQYATNAVLGWNDIQNAVNKAQIKITVLLVDPASKLTKTETAVLETVRASLSAVLNSAKQYAEKDGVLGKVSIAEEQEPTAEAREEEELTAEAPAPAAVEAAAPAPAARKLRM
eukprot:scaffold18.g2046.t1